MTRLLKDLCYKLAYDSDAEVKVIGRRCLGAYDEFAGLRYAKLTPTDARQLEAAARAARDLDDPVRAGLLDEAVAVVSASLAA